jgi:hypothetical protein
MEYYPDATASAGSLAGGQPELPPDPSQETEAVLDAQALDRLADLLLDRIRRELILANEREGRAR